MKIEGYKFNEYDATYRKALFNVIERKENVIEVTDIEGGTSFILNFEGTEVDRRVRTWKNREHLTENHGVSITFGSRGIYHKLKYGGRKLKDS